MGRPPRRRRAAGGDGGPAVSDPRRPPEGARGQRLLQRVRQSGPLAALPHLSYPRARPGDLLERVPAGERTLRGRRTGHRGARRPRVDTRFPPLPGPGDASLGGCPRAHRRLLARPLPAAVGLRHRPVARGSARGAPRRRHDRLPDRARRRELPRQRAAVPRPAGGGQSPTGGHPRPRGPGPRAADRDRLRELPRARERPGSAGEGYPAARNARCGDRHARRRPARLHQGDPGAAAGVRAFPRATSPVAPARLPRTGGGALTRSRPRVPGAQDGDRRGRRPHRRSLHLRWARPDPVHVHRARAREPRGLLPGGRHRPRHAASRRDEPRRQGVRGVPGRRGWRPPPLGVRRRGRGPPRGRAREPLRPGGHPPGPRDLRRHVTRGTPAPHASTRPPGGHARRPLVDASVPRPARHDQRLDRDRRLNPTRMPPPVARDPFRFYTRLTLTRLTGRRAADLAEMVEHLRHASGSVIFHHTHHFLVQHQHLSPEPPNDFAFWVRNVLQEDQLGERLAAIDTVQIPSLGELRERTIAVIEDYLATRRELRTAPPGEEFHFMDAISFTLPTHHEASTLAEFAAGLREVGYATIAYHLFEARLRVGAE